MQSTPTKRIRRLHAPDFKHQVVMACQQPAASAAAVALAHGLNANLVRRWLKQAQQGQQAQPKHGALTVVGQDREAFVALPMAGIQSSAPEPIRLELRRGSSCVSLQWLASSAPECGSLAARVAAMRRGRRHDSHRRTGGWPQPHWTCALGQTRRSRAWFRSLVLHACTTPTCLPTSTARA